MIVAFRNSGGKKEKEKKGREIWENMGGIVVLEGKEGKQRGMDGGLSQLPVKVRWQGPVSLIGVASSTLRCSRLYYTEHLINIMYTSV